MTARNGSAEWRGDIKQGSGTLTVGNDVFQGPYTYGTRFGEDPGTNPEQLIAAAQAACFTMALAASLSAAGHAPQLLRTSARVDLRNIAGAPTLARLSIDTEGTVPGVNEQQFQNYAEEAKKTCPVARALAGIPEIVLTAKLLAAAA
jgi:osmotically inducible protein OsmC